MTYIILIKEHPLKADAADYRRLLADICRETLWEPIPMGANRRGLSPKDSL